jgi:hypothetical protein
MPSRPSLRVDTNDASLGSPSEWTKFSPSNRSVDPEEHLYPGGSPAHSRENSTLNIQSVMDSLDNSAWGRSIQRSVTQRRSGE